MLYDYMQCMHVVNVLSVQYYNSEDLMESMWLQILGIVVRW